MPALLARAPRRLLALLTALLLAAGLTLTLAGGPGSAAPGRERASATTGESASARTVAPRQRQACKRVKHKTTKRVSAKRGTKAGKRAGRKAYRRCLKRHQQSSTTTTGASTTTTGGTTGAVGGSGSSQGSGSTTTPTPSPSPTPTQPAPAQTVVTNDFITSVPDPETTAPVKIYYTLFQPAGSSAAHPVPLIFHSHGWGGSRTTDAADFADFLDAGYGVISYDQRGFGESEGQAYVENPDVEGHDVQGLIDLVSKLPWVQQDGPGDPHMGAIGGSYGGGYQFLGAFTSQERTGKPLFDALAPEITWNDLEESLAPDGVVRTAWASALTAAAQPTNALPASVQEGFAAGVVAGEFPADLKPFFAMNGPQYHTDVKKQQLDIPVLFGQGTTDSLFPLEQGFQNFQTALTPAARAKSIFIGYNGGHVLPSALPMGVSITSDPCSKQLGGSTFRALSLQFFDQYLKGQAKGLGALGGKYYLATPQDTCLTQADVDKTTAVAVPDLANTVGPAGSPAGPPASLPVGSPTVLVAQGKVTLAGRPYLTGTVTSYTPDARLFLGLAMGTSPSNAKLIQDNVLPLRLPTAVSGVKMRIALPSVAAEIPEGMNLYLVSSPVSDTFVGMGSRAPGAVTITDATLHVPNMR